MNPLWDYFWPIFTAGLVIGVVTGLLAYRPIRVGPRDRPAGKPEWFREWRRMRTAVVAGGAATALVAAASWHGLGAGDRLALKIETASRAELKYQEMARVSAQLERRPLRRRLVLSGTADDFQQAELVRILDEIPGVAGVRWAPPPRPSDGVK